MQVYSVQFQFNESMIISFFKRFFRRGSQVPINREIAPDEIFLDASNLPAFDKHQFEGRLERPISRRVIFAVGIVFILIACVFLAQSFALQIENGAAYAARSERNRLRHTVVFGARGVIEDRNKELLASNVSSGDGSEFLRRRYAQINGISHVLGYMKYPEKDNSGFYYRVDFEGLDGIEKYWNEYVAATQGVKIVETDALGSLQSESVLRRPTDGGNVTLTIDSRLSNALYGIMKDVALEKGFEGGAGVFMNVSSGEILVLVSYPEYSSQTLTDGVDTTSIKRFVEDARKPFLNRATNGLYTPGSIVKPFLALGALEEGVITPEKTIYSSGSISVKNPFAPDKPTTFKDWKAHGEVDMRRALAVSSNVYFYEIGGGFEGQRGLGIGGIEKYMRLFGFGAALGENDFFGLAGIIPNPEWKAKNFNGDVWRLGDTYHSSIGQYGFQVTPLQVARAVSAIANGGMLFSPRIVTEEEVPQYTSIPAKPESFEVVREGMRLAVRDGTAQGLNIPQVSIAAKTGTAELGAAKQFVNSWIIGFFPFESPRYAFAVIMERGPSANTVGALFVVRRFIEWISVYAPKYLKPV